MPQSKVQDDAVLLHQAMNLRALVDHVGAYFYAKDLEGKYLFANQAVCDIFGAPLEDVIGATDHRFVDTGKHAGLLVNDRRVFAEGVEVHEEEEINLLSGECRVFWSIKVPVRDGGGRVIGLCGISTDITQRRRAADHLIERNVMLSTVLSNIDASVYLKDSEGRFLYVNQRVADLYGRPPEEILGRTDADLLAPEVATRLMQMDRTVLASKTRQAREEVVVGPDNVPHHFWSIKLPLQFPGQPTCLIGFSSEITELMELRQSLARQRVTDPLTGLANRVQFEEELDLELRVAERHQMQLAVVLLDIDQFKYINNSLGQDIGDQLLRAVAGRLRAYGDELGGLARLSGDEFVLFVPRLASAEGVAHLIERIRTGLAEPFELQGRPLHLTVSAGISVYPDDAHNCAALLNHAEAAMYYSKERGRDQARFYSRAMGEAVALRLELERDLRGALAAGEFELHYQPKIRSSDGKVAGFEALLRWNRGGRGLVSPAHFIALAEQLGLLVQIGMWVVEEACRQMAAWRAQGLPQLPVAVNLSPSQLASPALVEQVAQAMARHGIAADGLEMEVTESMMMEDPEQAIAILHTLRRQGVKLSIDDFGTGYSSMAYLKRLPVDTLKLDRQFVTYVASDTRDADICAGMIALAHKLGLSVVAEGVETEEQRAALAARECDLFQGYFFSRPLPADQATAFIRDRS
ncbi:putative bifunctional diguanylate cyclase/phosphodiesterase [Herbaspirillum robiniae]|uniref:GGDEF domain-containing protein n=1 Tax=Herbaspirillum robiniae TaxID=2014887 RepID=A0A246WM20_9BURK|nr:EAL domain-containing protein [Herbaspirillum robiniae]OWY27328.1 GGDEF domain-containing protein [Herbaspirillum robiniae]